MADARGQTKPFINAADCFEPVAGPRRWKTADSSFSKEIPQVNRMDDYLMITSFAALLWLPLSWGKNGARDGNRTHVSIPPL
jgi:hypothetical protein